MSYLLKSSKKKAIAWPCGCIWPAGISFTFIGEFCVNRKLYFWSFFFVVAKKKSLFVISILLPPSSGAFNLPSCKGKNKNNKSLLLFNNKQFPSRTTTDRPKIWILHE